MALTSPIQPVWSSPSPHFSVPLLTTASEGYETRPDEYLIDKLFNNAVSVTGTCKATEVCRIFTLCLPAIHIYFSRIYATFRELEHSRLLCWWWFVFRCSLRFSINKERLMESSMSVSRVFWHIFKTATLDHIVTVNDLGSHFKTTIWDNMVAFDTIVEFVILFVALLTTSPLMRLEHFVWNFSVFLSSVFQPG